MNGKYRDAPLWIAWPLFVITLFLTACAGINTNQINKAIEKASHIPDKPSKTDLDAYIFLSQKAREFSVKPGYSSLNNLSNYFSAMYKYAKSHADDLFLSNQTNEAYIFIKNCLQHDFIPNDAPKENIVQLRHLGFIFGMSLANEMLSSGQDVENILAWLQNEKGDYIFKEITSADALFGDIFQFYISIPPPSKSETRFINLDQRIEHLENIVLSTAERENQVIKSCENIGTMIQNQEREELIKYKAFPPSINNPHDILGPTRLALITAYESKFTYLLDKLYKGDITLHEMDMNDQYIHIMNLSFNRAREILSPLPEPLMEKGSQIIRDMDETLKDAKEKTGIIRRSQRDKKFATSLRSIIDLTETANPDMFDILEYYRNIQKRIIEEIFLEQPDNEKWKGGINEHNSSIAVLRTNIREIDKDKIMNYIDIVRFMIKAIEQEMVNDFTAACQTYEKIYLDYNYFQARVRMMTVRRKAFDHYLIQSKECLGAQCWEGVLRETLSGFQFSENEEKAKELFNVFMEAFQKNRQMLLELVERQTFELRFLEAHKNYHRMLEWECHCLEEIAQLIKTDNDYYAIAAKYYYQTVSDIAQSDKGSLSALEESIYDKIDEYLIKPNSDKPGYLYYCYKVCQEIGPPNNKLFFREKLRSLYEKIQKECNIKVRWEGWGFERENSPEVVDYLTQNVKSVFESKNYSFSSYSTRSNSHLTSPSVGVLPPVYWAISPGQGYKTETVVKLKGTINHWKETLQTEISNLDANEIKVDEIDFFSPQKNENNKYNIGSMTLKRYLRFQYNIECEVSLDFYRCDEKNVQHLYAPLDSFRHKLDESQIAIKPLDEIVFHPIEKDTSQNPSEQAREEFLNLKKGVLESLSKDISIFINRQDIMKMALLEPARLYQLYGEPERAIDYYQRYLILNHGKIPPDCPNEYIPDLQDKSLATLFSYAPQSGELDFNSLY